MAASKTDLIGWFQRGVKQGATHVIVVCDTYDWEDYPVYVTSDQNVLEEEKKYAGVNMQKVMEVYNRAMSMGAQMAERRAFNY